MDKDHIKSWFGAHWDENLRGEASRRTELEAHLGNLLDLELKPWKLDEQVVISTRANLLRVPVGKRVYERIRSNPVYLVETDVMDDVGGSIRTVFNLSASVRRKLQVPLLFTKNGFDNIDMTEESPVVADVVNERWMLSDDDNKKVDFVSEDLGRVSKQVKEIYLDEYTKVWDSVYRALEVVDFRNLRHADEVLAAVVDPTSSPLIGILQVASQNTLLSNQALSNLEGKKAPGKLKKLEKLKGVAGAVGSHLENPVDKYFKELNALTRESKRGPAPVDTIVAKVQQLYDFIADVSLSPDPAKKAYDIAKARYESGAGNPIIALRALAKNQPEPVSTWLDKMADQSWKVILQSARDHIDAEWKDQVYLP